MVSELLPSVKDLQQRCIALAILDAALMEDWEYRIFLYNKSWDTYEQMASMRGDREGFFIVFRNEQAFCKIFDENTEKHSLEEVHLQCSDFLNEPAFEANMESAYAWKLSENEDWKYSRDLANNGPARFLISDMSAYVKFAETYYETSVDSELVERFAANPDVELFAREFVSKQKRSIDSFLNELYSEII